MTDRQSQPQTDNAENNITLAALYAARIAAILGVRMGYCGTGIYFFRTAKIKKLVKILYRYI